MAINPGKVKENYIQEFYHTIGEKDIESSRTDNPTPRYLKLQSINYDLIQTNPDDGNGLSNNLNWKFTNKNNYFK
jgi:hypothetical protein